MPKSAAAYPHRPDDRPNVEAAAKAWYAQARTAFAQAHDGKLDDSDRVPMVIVATAGGGIRAADRIASPRRHQEKTWRGRPAPLPLCNQRGFRRQRRRDGLQRGSRKQRRGHVRKSMRPLHEIPGRGFSRPRPRERYLQGHPCKLSARSAAGRSRRGARTGIRARKPGPA